MDTNEHQSGTSHFRYRVRPVSHAGTPQKAQKSQNEFFEPVVGRLADLITQGPHALVFLIFPLFCVFVPFVAIGVYSCSFVVRLY